VKSWFDFGNESGNPISMGKILYVIFFIGLQYSSFGSSLLPDFTAVYNSRKKAVIIKWQHTTAGVKTYVTQRSPDNNTWTDIALQEIDPTTKNRIFYFEDKKPTAGENHYRLKCIYEDGRTDYSLGVTVIIGSTNSWAMYPVPVTDLLTLEYRGSDPIQGVINVIIQQAGGRVLLKRRYSSQNKQIQITTDFLPKGIFDIRIIVQEETIWSQRLVK
jgi:hypothetical protein